jgi:hypothetical protein
MAAKALGYVGMREARKGYDLAQLEEGRIACMRAATSTITSPPITSIRRPASSRKAAGAAGSSIPHVDLARDP